MCTNPGKLSQAKGMASFLVFFYLNYLIKNKKDPPDWIILDIWALLSFVSVDIFLAKAFLLLLFRLDFRNNSCGNSLSWKFFLDVLNVIPVLFFATDFNLFNYVFVSLTLAST